MKAVLFLLLLCPVALPASAQWVKLGSSEYSLIAKIGKRDSSNSHFDYFHLIYHGVNGKLTVATNSKMEIQAMNWNSGKISPATRDLISQELEEAEDTSAKDPFNTFGYNGKFRIWLTEDSITSLVIYDSAIDFRNMLRAQYYGNFHNSEPIPDSFFSVGEWALPLDSESIQVAKAWKMFLELPPFDLQKYELWSRHDRLMRTYFSIPECPDYYSGGYLAKLVEIVKDPELDVYILSTVFSPADSNNSPYKSSFQKTSRQVTYFIKEDGYWKITSSLNLVTQGWEFRKVDSLIYHFPSNHVFNESKARAAQHFLDSISTIFGVASPSRIFYYFAFQSKNIFSLLGLDVSTNLKGILLDGKSIILLHDTNEDYLHELVHAALSPIPRSPIITEGIAELLAKDTNYGDLEETGELLKNSKNISIRDIWNLMERDTASYLIYSTGLIFFQKVFERGGMKAVVAFYKASTSEPEFELAVKRYLNVEPADIDKYWRDEIEKAYDKIKANYPLSK